MSTREEFEKWAESQGFSIKEYDPINNSYLDDHADVAWWAWEASARVEREACALVCEEGWKRGLGEKFQGGVFATAIRARGDA